MSIENIILQSAETTDPLELDQLTTWINHVQDGLLDNRRRKIVERTFPKCGNILPHIELSRVIQADINDDEVIVSCNNRRIILERMRILLPSILNEFCIKDIQKARTVTLFIDDHLYDFSGIINSDQKRKNERIALEGIDELSRQCLYTINLLDKNKRYVDIEYDHHKKEVSSKENSVTKTLDDFIKDMSDLDS
jgi:hypothetical protein